MQEPLLRNYEDITLESDTLQQVRENFNLLLQKLFRKMEQNNSVEGSITLKLDIELQQDWIDDENGDSVQIMKPLLKHKVTTTVPVKDAFDGKKDTGMNLVYDEELGRYVLRYVSVGGQRSIFDDDFQESMNGNVVDAEGTVIKPAALPDNSRYLPEHAEGYENADNSPSDAADIADEENTEEKDESDAGGYTEAGDGINDGYQYDDPEEV